MKNPPVAVFTVAKVYCVIHGVEPSWKNAQKIIGEGSFLKRMLELDPNSLSPEAIQSVRDYVSCPQNDPSEIKKVSCAASSFAKQLFTLDKYLTVMRFVYGGMNIYRPTSAAPKKTPKSAAKSRSHTLASSHSKPVFSQSVL